jgi:hypothetical protein
MPQVSIQPLLSQHRNERGEKRNQKTREQESGGGDNLARWVFWGSWDGGDFVWDCGTVEGEEDGTEEGHCLVVGVGLELRIDVDDESRANGGEQTRLREQIL